MFSFLKNRRRQAEWLDEPDADPRGIRKSLAFIRWINRTLRYTQVILNHLARFSANWKKGQTIRIVDVGTGSADIPAAILQWADRRGFKLNIVGVDLNARIAAEARAAVPDPRLQIMRGNAMALPFADGSFDYAITSMFLHHLDDGDAEQALREMSRVARRGIIASDLLRKKHAYVYIWLLTIFCNRMVKHDARVSVAQAFNRAEVMRLREAAGVQYAEYSTHMRHRFVLAGEKPNDEIRIKSEGQMTNDK